jgi:hypothetical protein
MILIVAALTFSCSIDEPQQGEMVAENLKSSGCGGFSLLSKSSRFAYEKDSADYCSSEKFHWHYDQSARKLSLLHTRIVSDCGSEWKVNAYGNDEGIFIEESNVSTMLADCICNYDTYCELNNVHEGVVTITHKKGAWEIDLSEESGYIVVDATPSGRCP